METRESRGSHPLTASTHRMDRRWEKLIWRLNKLDAGKRYQILITVGQEPDWTVTELGKVER